MSTKQTCVSVLSRLITAHAAAATSTAPQIYNSTALHTHRCSSCRCHRATAVDVDSRTTHSNTGAGCPRRRRSSAARKTHPRVTCEGWLYRGRPQRQSVDRPLPPPATLSGRFTTAHVVCTSERTTTYRGHFLFRWSH